MLPLLSLNGKGPKGPEGLSIEFGVIVPSCADERVLLMELRLDEPVVVEKVPDREGM